MDTLIGLNIAILCIVSILLILSLMNWCIIVISGVIKAPIYYNQNNPNPVSRYK